MSTGNPSIHIQDKRFEKLYNPTIEEHIKKRWLSNEAEYWSSASPNVSNEAGISADLNTYIEALNWAINDFSDKNLQKFIKTASYSNLPTHEDPGSEIFLKILNQGGMDQAIYAFRLATAIAPEHYQRGFISGKNEQANDINKVIAESISSFQKKTQESENEINKLTESTRNEVQAIVDAATSAITLSEPVKFWDTRQKQHKEAAATYGKRAMQAAAAFFTILVLLLIYEYSSGAERSIFGFKVMLPKNAISLALILILTTGGIWAIRVFIKLMMANLTLETDSLERATMIKTFVAMQAASGNISPEHQLLFYTTLFRPTNNAIGEDSTAPEFSKLLDTILKSRGDGKPI